MKFFLNERRGIYSASLLFLCYEYWIKFVYVTCGLSLLTDLIRIDYVLYIVFLQRIYYYNNSYIEVISEGMDQYTTV